jgi:putative AlgH/UPF0301 family transcriptional regulator
MLPFRHRATIFHPREGHVWVARSASNAKPRTARVKLACQRAQLGPGQGNYLEGWINVDAEPGIIFDTPVGQRYGKALSLLGIDAGMLSSDAGHA